MRPAHNISKGHVMVDMHVLIKVDIFDTIDDQVLERMSPGRIVLCGLIG